MHISACNRLTGRVLELKKGKATTHLRLDTGGQELAAVVTSSAVEDLGLAVGEQVAVMFREVDVLLMTGSGSVSAGNRFRGTVLDIKKGTVTAEIPLDVSGQRIVAVVARTAAEAMGITVGDEVTGVVREIDLLLVKGDGSPRASARNRMSGRLTGIRNGTVTTELTVDLGGRALLALVARSVAEEMKLSVGDQVTGLFREVDVLVMKE